MTLYLTNDDTKAPGGSVTLLVACQGAAWGGNFSLHSICRQLSSGEGLWKVCCESKVVLCDAKIV